MDWFKGNFTGKPHDLNGKIYGFQLRFSLKPIHVELHIEFWGDQNTAVKRWRVGMQPSLSPTRT
jgi:hypothetical protein